MLRIVATAFRKLSESKRSRDPALAIFGSAAISFEQAVSENTLGATKYPLREIAEKASERRRVRLLMVWPEERRLEWRGQLSDLLFWMVT